MSFLLLHEIAEKADNCAAHLRSPDGLQRALRNVAQNIRDVIAADYRALPKLEEARAVMRDMVDAGWWEHEEGCPEDNTCECALIRRVNEVLR